MTRWSLLSAVIAGTMGVSSIVLSGGEPAAVLLFRNINTEAGLSQVAMRSGGPEKRWIPEANGSGVAWLDYDNDGNMDLLIVNGGTMKQVRALLAGEAAEPLTHGVYLFRNSGNGKFEDVTEKAGLTNPYWGTGANAADYDNDGYTDILVTSIGRDLLFHNNGDGTFREVSKSAGLAQTISWHTGSAFGDFDGDGKLDLFITGYADIHALPLTEPAPVCDYQGQHVFCGPIGTKGETVHFYRNLGNGTFADATQHAGFGAVAPVHGFTAVTGDFNRDGKLDILVANDSDPNYLFLNQGNGTFKEEALDLGLAFNADGRVQSNMGLAVGAYGGSLTPDDVLITTFNKDYFPLFRRTKDSYEDVASSVGLVRATAPYLGWACGLADFSNGGQREFWTANGHVYPTDKDYLEPITIFRNAGGKAALAYSYPTTPDASYRGGAAGDFDNDGRIDLVILPIAGIPVLLRNETAGDNHWVGLGLRGTVSNRDAIGAQVTIEACGQRQSDEVRNGGSYISHNDSRLHFGVGKCGTVDRVTVRWPSGTLQTVPNVALNRYTQIQERR